MSGKVPAVFSPNYSVGVNILFKLAEALKAFPQGYDFSISEIHHTGKKDAPSGTAKKLEQIVSLSSRLHENSLRKRRHQPTATSRT